MNNALVVYIHGALLSVMQHWATAIVIPSYELFMLSEQLGRVHISHATLMWQDISVWQD
jgi:hypothetical protein